MKREIKYSEAEKIVLVCEKCSERDRCEIPFKLKLKKRINSR